jgi:hypothetical protein
VEEIVDGLHFWVGGVCWVSELRWVSEVRWVHGRLPNVVRWGAHVMPALFRRDFAGWNCYCGDDVAAGEGGDGDREEELEVSHGGGMMSEGQGKRGISIRDALSSGVFWEKVIKSLSFSMLAREDFMVGSRKKRTK